MAVVGGFRGSGERDAAPSARVEVACWRQCRRVRRCFLRAERELEELDGWQRLLRKIVLGWFGRKQLLLRGLEWAKKGGECDEE